MSEARKGLRVRMTADVRARHLLPTDTAIDLRRSMLIPREGGTLTSGRILRQRPGEEEGLFVRVKWDGLPTPESWHLHDLEAVGVREPNWELDLIASADTEGMLRLPPAPASGELDMFKVYGNAAGDRVEITGETGLPEITGAPIASPPAPRPAR